jgi:N-methylhydantoinase A/oxoprolinase/acetone carboxylase beta subunit
VFHIGVDIGGTFTDCVLVGESTEGTVTYSTAKTLSTKADPAEGVLAGLTKLAANAGLARPELLARTGRFGHGTTIGTNAARPGAAMLLREYLCPLTGLRLATELVRSGDDPAPDMVLAG